ETNLFCVEGIKSVLEIPTDYEIKYFILSESYAKKHSTIEFSRAPVHVADEKTFAKASGAVTPQGVIAVCRKKEASIKDFANGIVLVLCETQDPGNVGTLVRVADAAGCTGVILTKGCADVYGKKAVSAAAASVFRVPLVTNVDADMTILTLKKNFLICGTSIRGENLPYSIDFTKNCVIIIGNEGAGLSQKIESFCDKLIKIPMPGHADSLNAAVAGGIIVFETVRQRIM
ncbi:MAG: RNA methyltransferase, partial [Clostridiales bacterium]|nr:RNA methyltransferase [Clostridiales bacterium]